MNTSADLRRDARHFQAPILHKSLLQVATSFGGFWASCAAMYLLSDISYWLSLALAPLAAGFLVRIFIIQHDCGHWSFFRERRANDLLGFACSLFTLAPYASWRRQHAGHHGVWNNLDRRQSGADIYSSCLTVAEYNDLSPWRRWWYRTTRHPLVANLLLPPLVFLGLYRVPFDAPPTWRRERRAVYVTDAALVALFGGLGLLLGFGEVASIQLPVMILASIIGVWLFSVQHRAETTRWARERDLGSGLSLPAGIDLPAPAGRSAMVHREYRFSSCASSECTHPPTIGSRNVMSRSASCMMFRPCPSGRGSARCAMPCGTNSADAWSRSARQPPGRERR